MHEFLNKEGENHLIIPIGMATISRDRNDVVTNEITHDSFSKTKRFAKGFLISPDYEVGIYTNYRNEPDGNQITFDDNFYKREGF
jgi:hypothetical protein